MLISNSIPLEYGWTLSHGFFAIMGGFMLFRGNHEVRTLQPAIIQPGGDESQHDNFISYLEDGEIDITAKKIKDRSRGDAMSKAFAVIQTGWFVLQCMARLVQHLPVTELEIVTLAFASLNLVTYVLWWEKPLDVKFPYPVRRQRKGEGNCLCAGIDCEAPQEPTSGIGGVTTGLKSVYDIILVRAGWGDNGEMASGAKRVPTCHAGKLRKCELQWSSLAGVVVAT